MTDINITQRIKYLTDKLEENPTDQKPLQDLVDKIFKELDQLEQEMNSLVTPSGTPTAPGRTCRDIHFEFPSLTDGWYWIDPNLGVPTDAFEVWCNMTVAGGETCVHPLSNSASADLSFWSKSDGRNDHWFSELPGGQKIRYADDIQLQFLRLLHTHASQEFTYRCQNSVGWFSSHSGSHELAISFMTANNNELPTGKFNQSEIEFDGCSFSQPDGFTKYRINTRRLAMLPLIDFKPRDYGASGQKFGFQAGPVCFRSTV